MGTISSRSGGGDGKRPNPIEQGGKTGRLILSNSKLQHVPAEVWLIGNKLVSLDLSSNQLTELTSQIGSLGRLQTLKLSHNFLTTLPDELYHLSELKTLEADHNKLHTVAAVLPRTKLRTLDLSFNNFSGVVGHPFLAIPPSVTVCNLSNNRIQGFGDSFGFEALKTLDDLDLDNNCIEAIPASIGCLERLTTLKLRNNVLKTLPSELFLQTPVNRIQLEGNPISIAFLKTLEGFDQFLERRKQRIDKGIYQGVESIQHICGLEN